MEGQKAQVITGTILAATIIAVLKILHVFLQRKKYCSCPKLTLKI